MPVDLQNFTLTHLGNATVSVPQVEVSYTVTDSQSGTQREDFTGVRKLTFPGVMGSLTVAERREVLEATIMKVVEIKLRNLG